MRVSLGLAAALMIAPAAMAQQRSVIKVYLGDGSAGVDKTAAGIIAKATPQIQKCEANGVRVVGHADTFRDANGSWSWPPRGGGLCAKC